MSEGELGWIHEDVAQEFPRLRLRFATFDVRPGRSPAEVRERLATLSSRFFGARGITLRREAVPAAYRVFFHHVGLDPEQQLTPIEAAARNRLIDGEFASVGLVADALLIALVDTGVALGAFDATTLDGPLGIRGAQRGEELGRGGPSRPLVSGRLVVADAGGALAMLFGEAAAGHAVGRRTRRVTVYTVEVPGVGTVEGEEALWIVGEVLACR